MGRTTQVAWLDSHTDVLKRLHETGMSCAQMAVRINDEFGTSYSRNAVIGRASRIGLIAKNRPGQPIPKARPRERKPRVRIIQANGNSTRQRLIESVESEPIALRCAAVEPLNISLAELNGTTCHYPYGDASPYSYCGHAALGGAPYCDLHHELCHQPARLACRGRERPDSGSTLRRTLIANVMALAVVSDDEDAAA